MTKKDIILSLLLPLFASLNVIFIYNYTNELPAGLATAIRFTIVSLVSLPFVANRKKKNFKEIRSVIVIGFFRYSLPIILSSIALRSLSPELFTFFLQFASPFAVLFSIFILKEKPRINFYIGMPIALLGCYLIFDSPEINITRSIYLLFFIPALFGFSTTYIKKVNPDESILAAYSPISAIIFSGLYFIIFERNQKIEINFTPLFNVFMSAIVILVAGIIAVRLYRRNKIHRVAGFFLLTPIYTIFISSIFLKSSLSINSLTGCLVCLSGIAIQSIRLSKN